jgi:hypothetical protein
LQEVDQLPDQLLSLGSKLQEQVPNPFAGLVSVGSLTAPTVARGQLLRPFPQYADVQVVGPANRNSIYHAMQAKLEKRFHAGGAVLVSYTWAKMISDTDALTTWLESGASGTLQNFNNPSAGRELRTLLSCRERQGAARQRERGGRETHLGTGIEWHCQLPEGLPASHDDRR